VSYRGLVVPSLLDMHLLSSSASYVFWQIKKEEGYLIDKVERGQASTDVTSALRAFKLMRAVSCVGMLSMLEAMVQDRLSYTKPLPDLEAKLRGLGQRDLADRLRDFRDAINVLKHGYGPSYDSLLKRKSNLPFLIKDRDQQFFDEGNVAEVRTLIDVDDGFVIRCCGLVGDIVEVIDQLIDPP
jgi:hypothetical protein